MNNSELFKLYRKVQQKDRAAENILIAEHHKKYPNNSLNKTNNPGTRVDHRRDLHTMYLHLTRKKS